MPRWNTSNRTNWSEWAEDIHSTSVSLTFEIYRLGFVVKDVMEGKTVLLHQE